MKIKLLLFTMLLFISCEKSTNGNKEPHSKILGDLEDIESVIFSKNRGENSTRSMSIIDLGIVELHLLINMKDSTSRVLDKEVYSSVTKLEWEINGESYTSEPNFFFLKDLQSGNYKIAFTMKLGNKEYHDEIIVDVAEHSKDISHGFKNIYFPNAWGEVIVNKQNEIYFTSFAMSSKENVSVFKYTDNKLSKIFRHNNQIDGIYSLQSYKELYLDSQGDFWVGNWSNNILSKINGLTLDQILIGNEITHYGGDVHGMIDDKDDPNFLLITTHIDGMFRLNKTTKEMVSYGNQPESCTKANDMKYDNNGNLWIASDSRSHFFDGTDWTELDSIKDARRIAVVGNKVYMGDFNKGLFEYENGVLKTTYNTDNSSIVDNYIGELAVDNNNVLYIAVGYGSAGIYKFENATFTFIPGTDNYENITSIDFDSNNKMVFAHSGGIAIEQ